MTRDFIIVGAGLFGAVVARELALRNKKVLLIERRNHIAGNCYSATENNIDIQQYGAHIFHTKDEGVWNYVNRFSKFNRFTNSPLAVRDGRIFNLPFNMNMFSQVFGFHRPEQVKKVISTEIKKYWNGKTDNLEDKCIGMVGKTIFEMFVKEYTEKQWGKKCEELSPDIITRLPLRYTYDNNYFNDPYQGIPTDGYTSMIRKILVHPNIIVDMNRNYNLWDDPNIKNIPTLYTGAIDELFDYELGELGWRSLRFETSRIETDNYQGNFVVNFVSNEQKYTRVIEHKWCNIRENQNGTYITEEYPETWDKTKEKYYSINNAENNALHKKYIELAKARMPNMIFGGRLGNYEYNDMDVTIRKALNVSQTILT